MNKFKQLSNLNVKENEKKILDKWIKDDIYQKTLDARADSKNFVFYDGPATANGQPGLHHMVAKFLKDSICKYQTMKGHRVIRKIGWDTHGLPVELEVEKALGFKNKFDIEKFGIEKFNEECKKSVWKFQEVFEDLTLRMGQFVDLKNPYITYENEYMETEWHILKKFFEEGLFYKGHKVIPYCSRCGTGLATHEVAQGYKEVSRETVIVPFKLKEMDAHLLVWTTTPWTLISNVAVAVNKNEEYVLVESKENKFIIAKKLANQILGDDVNILKTYVGRDLEHMEYEQFLPYLSVDKKAFYITLGDFVSMDDGTGIVHLAPAFGEDDSEGARNKDGSGHTTVNIKINGKWYNFDPQREDNSLKNGKIMYYAFGEDDSEVAKKYNLPLLNPVDKDGNFTEGPWKGQFVFDADKNIIQYLKENEKLLKQEKISHNYPHCWRCDTPLIYTTIPSYYLEITKIKDEIIRENNKVNWYPSYVGEKRFGNWLENLNDWAISRDRYWGTPIPYYTCSCGHDHMIGSVKELSEMATIKIDESMDLHKPYIDKIKLNCPNCKGEMTRISDVLDCWFDSGAMPFSQYFYPNNLETFNDQFPADFICEGIDQTRGWFYTLIVISTFMKKTAPFKNVLVNDLLLDEEGKKMSKSRGNVVEPFEMMDKYGADVVRFYLPYVSPVWVPLKFSEIGLKEVYSKFFNPLKNTYNFFSMYANADNICLSDCNIEYEELELIDKWLLSKYHSLIKDVTNYYDEYDLNKVVKALTHFVSEDLSNWYIRRNRDRFWGSALNNSKKAVYKTTNEVLIGLSQLLAPISPFLAEEIYTNLTNEYSVHTSYFPKVNESYINKEIESKMDLAKNLISLGRMVREENSLKVRQPLKEILISYEAKKLVGDLKELIKEELNLKEVTFIKDLTKYVNLEVLPNYKEVGKIFGKDINKFKDLLSKLSDEEKELLHNKKEIVKEFLNEKLELTENMIEIRIKPKEGFNIGNEQNNFVILNTTLDETLIKEGIAREIVSRIQNIRKEKDYYITDRINVLYNGNDLIKESVESFKKYIKDEILCDEFKFDSSIKDEFQINDEVINLEISKV